MESILWSITFLYTRTPDQSKIQTFLGLGKNRSESKKNSGFFETLRWTGSIFGNRGRIVFFFWSCDFEIWEWLFRIRRKSITITSTIYDIESNICMGCTILALKFSFLKDYEFFSTLNSIISRTVLNHMVGTKVIAQKTLFMLINSLTEIVSFTTYS